MAVNVAMLKNPKVLALGAVFVVAGIYLSSQIQAKKKAAEVPPTEVTPNVVSVVGASQLEQQDADNRKLADTQQKLADLEDKQRLAEIDYQNRLASAGNDKDARLATQGAQYAAQIASLQAAIDALKASNAKPIAELPRVPGSPGIAPIKAPIVPVRPIETPVKLPPARVLHYPGLPDNYVMDCSKVGYRIYLVPYAQALALVKSKAMTNTSTQREMVNVALGGGVPAITVSIRGYVPDSPISTNRRYCNAARVFTGLQPLTDEEFDRLDAETRSLWNGNERDQVFQSGEYARILFEHWNLPYRCGVSVVRR